MRLQVPIVERIARRRLPGRRLYATEIVDCGKEAAAIGELCELANRVDLVRAFWAAGYDEASVRRRLLEIAEIDHRTPLTRGRA